NPDHVDGKKSQEVVKLQRENLALKQLLAQRSKTEKSNQSTSRLFGPKLISAQILLPDQQQRWKSGTLLDAGASDKIREQDWIISDELPLIDLGEDFGIKPDEILLSGRVVIGQIHAVGRWTSSYRAVTDSEFRCPATIIKSRDSQHTIERNDQQVQTVGSLHGTDQEICELRYIENTFPVRVGDLVVLADEQQRFEGSLVLGTIIEARVLSSSPFWKIQVRPVKTTETTRDVLVITEELNPLRLLTN
ncbi:MAG: rod shape-determining protein MreC, partial [Planctomycetaceae bacterium]|nr:rod shape-determining protein MreC [Planctomycetaceae bacterium]